MRSQPSQFSLAVGTAMVLLFLAVRISAGATILIDDFNDGNDDGWTHAPRTGGPAVWDASSGTYRLESIGAVPGPNGFASTYWDNSFNSQFRDGYLRATIHANNLYSEPIIYLRIADPNLGEAWKFYYFGADAVDGLIGIGRFDGPSGSFPPTSVAARNVGFSWGEDWIMEAGAVGDQLSLKAWRVGDPAPAMPQLRGVDATHISGGFGLDAGVRFGTVSPASVTFDDVFFTPAVPEPSACVLAAIGGVIVLVAGRRQKKRSGGANGRLYRAILFGLACMMQLPQFAHAEGETQTEEERLLTTDRTWAAAAATGNKERILSAWDAAAVNYFPGEFPAVGKEAIRRLVLDNRSRPGFSLTWRAAGASVAQSNDLGYTHGLFEASVCGPDGKPQTKRGHYVCIWKRQQDHSWKCVVGIANFRDDKRTEGR